MSHIQARSKARPSQTADTALDRYVPLNHRRLAAHESAARRAFLH